MSSNKFRKTDKRRIYINYIGDNLKLSNGASAYHIPIHDGEFISVLPGTYGIKWHDNKSNTEGVYYGVEVN